MAPRFGNLLGWSALLFATACNEQRGAAPTAASASTPSPSSTLTPAPTPTGIPSPTSSNPSPRVVADGCTGREPHDCAKTRGCILDQVTYNTLRCRPAEGSCERAVRHADLIGTDADLALTPQMMSAAEGVCNGTPSCVVTSGRCSCPCALLAHCDCACGGGHLRRCTTLLERSVYDGPPPVLGSPGPLAPLGDALVSVRRAPRSTPFVVKQLPATAGLVGKSRHEIENTLGGAMSCQDAITAPCKSAGQAFYSFYKLPEGQRGGGPELLLSFDSKSICTAATFAFTR